MRSVSSQSSLRDSGFFSLDLNGGKKANASRQGHRPPYWFSAFCRRVTVLRHAAHTSSKHSNAWKLCVDAHYPTGPYKATHFPTAVCPTSLAPCLSRRQVGENHDSTPHSFQWIYFHSNTLQGCIHLATVIWQILSCSIVGLVLRPSFVGHKLELFTVVPLVLFVVPESGGDSIKSLSCFSTIFLGSSTQTTWSSRFVRSHFGSSHFLFERARCLFRARFSGFVLSKCLQRSFVFSHLLSWHVRAMEQICQYLHYQPPLRTLVLRMVLFLTLKGQDTDDASLSNSTVACVSFFLLLLTIRIACMTISTRSPTKKLILQIQLLRLKLPNLPAKLLSQLARLEST